MNFTYDTYGGPWRLLPRAYTFLDYTQGSGVGIGAADVVHGESGDDTIHGQLGDDVLFGEGQDDDIYGGWGNDRLLGGTGQDGVMGDDGKFQTSRNGLTEVLHHLTTADESQWVSIPGPFTGAEIFIAGELVKRADLATWIDGLVNNDTMYGGLGDDFMHGGEGSDAMSGAEALRALLQLRPARRLSSLTRLATELPGRRHRPAALQPGYDEVPALRRRRPTLEDPGLPAQLRRLRRRRVHRPAGRRQRCSSSRARTAGTACTATSGTTGWSAAPTATGCSAASATTCCSSTTTSRRPAALNTDPENDDPRFRDGDFAYGGAGRDVLIANTGQDRMFDWGGEFNSYIVPFSPFGIPTVNRLFSPATRNFIRALSVAGGSDEGLIGLAIPPGEPFDEEALVEPSDGQLWQDQHGGPRDPQPGNLPGGGRDDVGEPNLHCPCEGVAIIRVVKYVNDQDGDPQDANATGPVLIPGSTVTWTYHVTNLSTIEIAITRLLDDAGTPADPSDDFLPIFTSGDTDGDGLLDSDELWLYLFSGIVQAGRYSNLATVEGTGTNGHAVSDTDPAVYFGSVVDLRIDKLVNGADADTSPLVVAVGTPLTFTYTVWTNGSAALVDVSVVDDAGTTDTMDDDFAAVPVVVVGGFNIGDVNRDGRLDPGELWQFTSPAGLVVSLPTATTSTSAWPRPATARRRSSPPTRPASAARPASASRSSSTASTPTTRPVWPCPWEPPSCGPTRSTTRAAARCSRSTSGTTTAAARLRCPSSRSTSAATSTTTTGSTSARSGATRRPGSARTRWPPGTYVNVATVTARTLAGDPLADDDDAHLLGTGTQLVVEKAVNAVDPLEPRHASRTPTSRPGRT